MKSTEVLLVLQVLTDVGTMCNTSIDRDSMTIESRVKNEGLSFLTITLPAFAKAFEKCLDSGCIDPSLFPWFCKTKKSNGVIPVFLSGILSKIFDVSGVIRTEPSIDAIDGIRQICLTFNKTKKECTDARKLKAIQAFKQCESDLRSFRFHRWHSRNIFRSVANICFGRLFRQLKFKLELEGFLPKHGPGAVVEGYRGNEKYTRMSWTTRLDRYLPLDAYAFANAEHLLSDPGRVDVLSSKDEPDVKVIFVPKTQKSPRVIAIEPTHMQYAQQSFLRAIVPAIEADPILGCAIHFTDSTINGRLARESSVHKKYATLDLSEASDRVHSSLAYMLFGSQPNLARAIFSCRSKYAKLPNGDRIPLVKFASMGSALCFPVESMVFYTLILTAIAKKRNSPLNRRALNEISRDVHVFGDDLIVPTDEVGCVIDMLESAGLKVNRGKTFAHGNFRESCGVDAYQGHIVTPVYIRTSMPTSRRDAEELVSTIATANLFYKKGYWNTARFMRKEISARVGPLPHVRETSPLLGWFSFLGSHTIERWNKTLHRFECRGLKTMTRKKVDPIEGYNRLLKFFIERGHSCDTTYEDPSRLTVRGSLYTQSRWSTSL